MKLQDHHILLLSTFLLLVLGGCKSDNSKGQITVEKATDSIFYGINFNHFEVIKDTVRKNETFGQIMLRNNIGYDQIYGISKEYRNVFDISVCEHSSKTLHHEH
jgi:murein DD-endopeptidase